MKVNFNIGSIQSTVASVENVTLSVEYTTEEFLQLVKLYPEIITLLTTTLTKE